MLLRRSSSLRKRIFGFPLLVLGVLLSEPSYGDDQTPAPTAAPMPSTNQLVNPAENLTKHSAMSLVDTPAFEKGFDHFPFANPHAPKAGRIRYALASKFDSLNPFSFKGDSFGAGLSAGLIHERLMYSSPDERAVQYGLIAEWAAYPDDYSSVTFKIRNEAAFSDGTPITPEDVLFSMTAVKQAHPGYKAYYKNITKGEKTAADQVTFYFDVKNNRELPFIVGELPILSKAYWTGKDKSGKVRDITKTSLEAPLGSGPYRYSEIKAGQKVKLVRRPDYWAKNLPVRKGMFNFNEIIYEVYRDHDVAFEAFKGDLFDYREESSSKYWATRYDFPAITKKKVVKRDDIFLKNPLPMQGFALNLRRKKFADIRTRKALTLAYNFDWANKNLFYGQYKRTNSYFMNTEMAANQLPKGDELTLLKSLNEKLPGEALTEIYQNPTFANREDERKNLREAGKLLKQAGWVLSNKTIKSKDCGFFCRLMISIGLKSEQTKTVLINDKNEPFKIEFLIVSPLFQRVILPYIKNLEKLGIEADIRLIDSSQYINRMQSFDFDMAVTAYQNSFSPGNEQRNYFGSKSADTPGSRNLMGIKNPAVDRIIDKIIYAKSRHDLVISARALDRILLWNYYMIPQWHTPSERIAYWNRFDMPKLMPKYQVNPTALWWWDANKDAKLKDLK